MDTPYVSLSEFNYVIERPDCTLGYNLNSGNFIILDQLSCQVLRAEVAIEQLPSDSLGFLESAGFLVRTNERKAIELRLSKFRKPTFYSHIVITPTIACNFRCGYCFQNDMRASDQMSDEIFDRVIEYLIGSVSAEHRNLKLTWFGGEPLLAIDRIEQFNVKLVKALGVAKMPIQDMITNGSLLDESVTQRLIVMGIKKIQVSFDSVVFKKGTHRGIVNEDGSPSIIASNALKAIAAGLSIVARVNVDARNTDLIPKLATALDTVGLSRCAYYARVDDDNGGANIPIRYSSTNRIPIIEVVDESHVTISRAEFAAREKQLLFNQANFALLLDKLKPRLHFCGATDGSMMVISPLGGVSRCWNSAGRVDEEICNILEPNALETLGLGPISEQWDSYSAFDHDGCRDCKVLPLCMGGCSHPRTMLEISQPPCTPVKYYIDDLVRYVGTHLSIEGRKQ